MRTIKAKLGLASALILWGSLPSVSGQGIDTFDPNVNGIVNAIVVRTDGKIVIGGEFTTVGGSTRNHIALLNSDGSLNATFQASASDKVLALAIQSDGRILAGGGFPSLGGHRFLARLSSDGIVESGFDPAPNDWVRSLMLQPDGKILVGGTFTNLAGQLHNYIGRLNTNGSADSFNASANDQVNTMALLPDGNILVGGFFTALGGQAHVNLGRLTSAGAPDNTFTASANNVVWKLALQPDGKIVVGGVFTALNGVARTNIGRLNANGSLDGAFNSAANNVVNSLALQPDGKILVGGNFTTSAGQPRTYIGRLNSDGSLDNTFNLRASNTVFSLVLQPDGKALVGGAFTTLGTSNRNHMGRSAASLAITSQPPTRQTVLSGSRVSLDVTAVGSGAISYQWRKQGLNIPGAVSANYVIASAQLSDSGIYSVVLSNGWGVLTTSDAALRVVKVLNDDFADAYVISSQLPTTVAGQNVGATVEPNEPNHASLVPAKSVWWTWTASTTAPVWLDPRGSSLDRVVEVYTGDSVQNLTSVASMGTFDALLVFNAVAGTTYHLAVDSANGDEGTIVFTLRPPPINDAFPNRSTITGAVSFVTGYNIGATGELNEPEHDGPDAASVWWTWTAPASGTVSLDTTGSSFDTVLEVYTGMTLQSLSVVASNAFHGATGGSSSSGKTRLSFPAVAGRVYQIVVDGAGGLTGTIVLDLRSGAAAANDGFLDRFQISGTAGLVTGSNVGASSEQGEPNHHNNSGQRSVWWTWTAPASGPVHLDTAGSSFDAILAVYTGATLSTLVEVASAAGSPASLGFNATAGTAYQIAVDGFSTGEIVLNFQLLPAGSDLFANRSVLTGLTSHVSVHNMAASKETGETNHGGLVGGKSVWWTWTAPSNGVCLLDTIGSSFDTILAVYTGTSVSALVPVASDNDSGGNGTSSLVFSTVLGRVYQIVVDGRAASSGTIALNLALLPPSSDSFAGRLLLSGRTNILISQNFLASKEANETNHAGVVGGKSVWWTWTAPVSGLMTVDTIGSSFDTLLGIYTGSSLASLALVASDDNSAAPASKLSFVATAGAAYQIAVDGVAGASGVIVLSIRPTPVNDAFANAPSINTFPSSLIGTTAGAGRQTGEPDGFSFSPDSTVWWRFVAPQNGSVTISKSDGPAALRIGVFQGTTLASLAEIVDNLNNTFPPRVECTVSFAVTQGVTYYIAIGSSVSDEGDFSCSVTLDGVPANDFFASRAIITNGSGTIAGSTLNATEGSIRASPWGELGLVVVDTDEQWTGDPDNGRKHGRYDAGRLHWVVGRQSLAARL